MSIELSASLPMYDWSEIQHENDNFWFTLRQALQDYGYHGLPEQLNRQNSACMGVNQHIGLTQTCGYPLKHQLGNQVELMGTPIYRATFCRDGYYASVVLVRQEDSRTSLQEFRGATRPSIA